MRFDERGRELPDDTPVEAPLHWRRPPSLREMIQQHIRTEMSRQAMDSGFESFEDADDFDVPDPDPDPLSVYELREMQEEMPRARLSQEEPAAPAKPAAPAEPSTPGDGPET